MDFSPFNEEFIRLRRKVRGMYIVCVGRSYTNIDKIKDIRLNDDNNIIIVDYENGLCDPFPAWDFAKMVSLGREGNHIRLYHEHKDIKIDKEASLKYLELTKKANRIQSKLKRLIDEIDDLREKILK